MDDYYYTVHHNWAWVFEEALQVLKTKNPTINLIHCSRLRDLPSQRSACLKSKSYALFRIENRKAACWSSSGAFADLDPKDALYRALEKVGLQSAMPETYMLPWDLENTADIPLLPSVPSLLKAACGSGGFGLYYVYSSADILQILKFHRTKALAEVGFLKKLMLTHKGSVPMWSLQATISSKLILTGRRCQIRGYAIYFNRKLYLYKDLEVRMPSWGEADVDSIVLSPSPFSSEFSEDPAENFDIECCAGSNARPYNKGRIKSETMRFAFSEISELAHLEDSIISLLVQALQHLQPEILMSSEDDDTSKNNMAIAGIDLMVSSDGLSEPKILEFNNNPAMPGMNKNMSEKYRKSLITFVTRLIVLGLSETFEVGEFYECW